jgi:hypothetical protein
MSDKRLSFMFWLSTISVLPFWLLIIFLPRWPLTRRVMKSLLPVLLPASLHTAFVVMLLSSRPDLKDDYSSLFPLTPGKVIAKMTERDIATASWLHMLPGDLMMGRWMYFDSQEQRLSHWLMVPALSLTLSSGPIGFVLYLIVRALHSLAPK